MNPRSIAALILSQVIYDKRSLSFALASVLEKYPSHRQTNLIKELCYGVLRWYFRLDALLKQLLPKPLKAKDHDIQMLLLIGLYQILYLRISDHAAVSETVEAARELKKVWATKLINGVLRNFLRQRETLINKIESISTAHYAHPQWFINATQESWPNDWQNILLANNEHPPLCLRVNALKINRTDYLKKLADANIEATPSHYTSQGIILKTPMPVENIPGFLQGEVSVQDNAAQLAADLLELAPEQRILDACAAPGGKTAHILEIQPALKELIAIDQDPQRLQKIKENLDRLNLSATLIADDASQPNRWWDNHLFDRILLDAPCSATGVIRRHPDIKILRQMSDISALAQQQLDLLTALWPLLKPKGILLYLFCVAARK